jgi:hypothetical protein
MCIIDELNAIISDQRNEDVLTHENLMAWFQCMIHNAPGFIFTRVTLSQIVTFVENFDKKSKTNRFLELTSKKEKMDYWSEEENKILLKGLIVQRVHESPAAGNIYCDKAGVDEAVLLIKAYITGRKKERLDSVRELLFPKEWTLKDVDTLDWALICEELSKVTGDINMYYWLTLDGHLLLSLFGVVRKVQTFSRGDTLLNQAHTVSQSVCDSAFRIGYRNIESLILFKNHLSNIYSSWKSTEYYAPYCALVTASMMGKSRLLCELPETGLFSFLFCFRDANRIGTPPRTPVIADLIQNQKSKNEIVVQHTFFRLIVACVQTLGEWLRDYNSVGSNFTLEQKRIIIAKHWFIYQKSGDIKSRISDNVDDLGFSENARFFWNRVVSKISELKDTDKSLLEIYYTCKTDLTEALGIVKNGLIKHFGEDAKKIYKNSCMVFGYDEARILISEKIKDELLNLFHIMRRSFFLVPEPSDNSLGMVAVFTDTTSRVSNFSPSKPWDYSLRALAKGTELFEPYSSLLTLDVFYKEALPLKLIDLETEYTKIGRPAFHATILNSPKSDADARLDLIKVVAVKIRGKPESEEIGSGDAVAILGALVPLNVSPTSSVASDLVASNMRYCVGISEDRNMVFSLQPAEPVMALAAMLLVQQIGWTKILEKASNAFGTTVTDIGYKGELGIQIACIMASARCLREITGIWHVVTLESFLRTLLGDDVFRHFFSDNTKLANLVVRLGQFIKYHNDVKSSKLLDYFKRSCGIVCKTNQKGCDLIIPVFHDILGNGQTPLDEKYITCLSIQVKYRKDRETGDKLKNNFVNKLSASYCQISGIKAELPYFSLYVDIGERPEKILQVHTDRQRVAMSVIGYNIKHMFTDKPEVCTSFTNLLYKAIYPHTNPFLSPAARDTYSREIDYTHSYSIFCVNH